MEKYQITEEFPIINRKAGKALVDISTIGDSLGFRRLIIKIPEIDKKESDLKKIIRHYKLYKVWRRFDIAKDSVIFFQMPFGIKQWYGLSFLQKIKRKKKLKYICMVHDVEELRAAINNKYYEKEFNFMMKMADVLIIHNNKMKQFFMKKGIAENRLVVLHIFDYLLDNKEIRLPKFERSVSIAGNLSFTKASYIAKLERLNGVSINLYGADFNQKLLNSDNIIYRGSFSSDKIPEELTAGFGLVWDGDSIDTCNGNYGEYLKYNSPYKLSLYLSAGIPVVIWSQAAEAEFVQKYGLGICVDSLYDLENVFEWMTEERYVVLAENVRKIRKKLIKGEYTREAISAALKKIEE